MTLPAAAPSTPATAAGALDLVRLLKLRLNSLVLLAVAASWVLALPAEVDVPGLLVLLVGTLAAAGGSSAINQGLEGARDRLMERTRMRPVAAGRITRDEALTYGAMVSALGVLVVGLGTNWLAGGLVALTVVLYAFAYTPLKTRTTLNTLVGAFPGALPALVGWAAATGRLPAGAWALFAIVFVWQFPHFLAIAAIHRDDYARAGFAMLPVRDPAGLRTAAVTLGFALVFVPTAMLPGLLRLTGPAGFWSAGALALVYLAFSLRAAALRTPAAWRDLLRASLAVLPGMFVLMMIDRLPA